MAMTIGRSRAGGVAPTTLRYYEQIGLLTATQRVGGQRRYDESALSRLEVIRMCRSPASLEEIAVLFADDEPGRPASRALAQAKLAEIDSQMALLAQARQVVEWGWPAPARRSTPAPVAFTAPRPTSPTEASAGRASAAARSPGERPGDPRSEQDVDRPRHHQHQGGEPPPPPARSSGVSPAPSGIVSVGENAITLVMLT